VPAFHLPDPLLNLLGDPRQTQARFAQHIEAGNAHHAITALAQKSIPYAVPLPSVIRKVIGAVDFEDQSQLDAAEVGRIRGNRILAAKLLVADLPVANPLPDGVGELVGRGATANGRTRWRQAVLARLRFISSPHPRPLSPKRGEGGQFLVGLRTTAEPGPSCTF
jgi:hypothetical protein